MALSLNSGFNEKKTGYNHKEMVEVWDWGFCHRTNYCVNYGGSGGKLLFGDGTILRVKPDLEESQPSVYPLTAPNETVSAWLVTDFFPDDITVTYSGNRTEQTNGSIVQVKNPETGETDASYGMVVWKSGFQLITARGTNISVTQKSAERDETCMALALADVFVTDEKLNFLSLTMMGLRIIFVKGVAVNLLLTLCLWKS